MGKNSITISDKYGVNPSITHCPICGKEIGLALFGRLKGDEQAPRDCMNNTPCDDCQKVLDSNGHIFIEVKDGESGNNPYRTGRIIGITNEAAERIFTLRPVPKVAYIQQSQYESIFGKALKENKKK